MLTRARMSWLVALVALATIVGALVFEAAGYAPCKLCLEQRFAYYAGIPLAVLAAFMSRPAPRWASLLLVIVALAFAGNALFGAWHAGVEWGAWPGPADCAPAGRAPALGSGGLLQQMQTTRVISCTEPALRILGLSLAGWNAVISAGLALTALFAAVRARAAL